MFDSIRRKVFGEIFLAPSVVLTAVAGASALLFSWAVGGNSYLTLAGVGGVLGAIGWAATRAIFGVEKITLDVIEKIQSKQRQAEEDELEELLRRLRSDRDHRTQDFLTVLRTVREDFEENAVQPGVQLRSREIVSQVRQLFGAAVGQLQHSLKLYDLSERLIGDQRNRILKQREQVLGEVEATINHLHSVTKQYTDLLNRDQQVDLSVLRDELDTSLRVAKRTEERMSELSTTPDYETYLRE